MKKLLSALLIFLISIHHSQIITGKIQTDRDTPISEVNVYLDGTKISTLSKADGTFELDIQGQKTGNLIFQKNQYQTSIFPVEKALGKSVKVVINPEKEIEEIVLIPFTEEAYRNHIYYFLDQFLGTDREGVTIKNQRSLKFSYDKKNKILKVKAPQTLIIENKKLGYTIQYNLLDFQANFKEKSTSYLGSSYFQEHRYKKEFILNRMNAYQGSLMHFLRSLYNNNLEKDGYIVNHGRRIPNPEYPTDKEIEMLDAYFDFAKTQKVINVSLPANLEEIATRKRTKPQFLMAVLKSKMKETEFTTRKDGKLYLDFNDLLLVNYKKYFYEIKKGEFVRAEGFVTQSSIVHPEAAVFEIYPEGLTSEPDLLIVEDHFSRQNTAKMLPLDYTFGN